MNKTTKRKSRSKRRSKNRSKCKKYLQDKIRINMDEYKNMDRYVSRAQAIAVSYSQTIKKHPRCKRVLSKRK